MISVLGAVFALLVAAALIFRREMLLWILSAAIPFSATAGLTVAGQSIVIYHVVALVVIAVAAYHHRLGGILGADVNTKPGLRPLLAFGVWSLAVTALAPTAFAGIKVLDPREGIDDGIRDPARLAPSISNFAQSGYLLIGIATVFAVASMRVVSPLLPSAGFAAGTVLSSARSLLPDSANVLLFDNSANVSYTTGEFDGVERMRGIFSEPSALGAFSVAAAVFFLMSASRARGPRRWAFIALGFWAVTNAVLSYSGGAVASGLVVLGLVAVQKLFAYSRGRLLLSGGGLVAGLLLTTLVFVTAPGVYAFVDMVFTDKAGSSSYENRNAADAFSYSLTSETLGVGVGVGSNRPSSFLASLLSTTGAPGLILLTAAVAVIAMRAAGNARCHPAIGALVALIVSKIVSGPDVSEPPMWFLLAVCAAAAWGATSTAPSGSPSDAEEGRLTSRARALQVPPG